MSTLTADERKKLPLEDFGDPDERAYPIVDASDVVDAAHLIGKANDPAAVKARIIRIAKRKGFPLPDAWKEDDNSAPTREAASPSTANDAPTPLGPDGDGDEDNDADNGFSVGDHVSWNGDVDSSTGIAASYIDGSQMPSCGVIRSLTNKKRTARIDRHDHRHKPTGHVEEHPTTHLQHESGRATAARESAAAPAPVVETPDVAKRAGAAIPTLITGAIVREAQLERDYPNRRRVLFMREQQGNGRFKNNYTQKALTALVSEIQRRPKGFWDHAPVESIMRGDERSLKDVAAVAIRESVHYDPVQRCVVGDIECAPTVRETIDLAHAAGDTIGVSIEGVGKREKPGSPDIVGWLNYQGFCLVPEGGAGGMTVREADTPALIEEEHEFAMGFLDTLTASEVKDANHDLYEAIGKEYAAAHPAVRETASTPAALDGNEVERLFRESETYQSIVREAESLKTKNEELATTNQQLTTTVGEMLAKENSRQVAAHAEALIREAHTDFTEAQVAYVLRGFDGATLGPDGRYTEQEVLDAAVREAADTYASTLPAPPATTPTEPAAPVTPKGAITGLGPSVVAPVKEAASGDAAPPAYTPPRSLNDQAMEIMESILTTGR